MCDFINHNATVFKLPSQLGYTKENHSFPPESHYYNRGELFNFATDNLLGNPVRGGAKLTSVAENLFKKSLTNDE